MKEKIMIGKKTISMSNGYHKVIEIKASLFVDPTKITEDGKLDIFILIAEKQYNICEYDENYGVEVLGMTREDWEKYNWKDLVE